MRHETCEQQNNGGELYYSALEIPALEEEQRVLKYKGQCKGFFKMLYFGRTGKLLSSLLTMLTTWGALVTVTKHEALPGGNLFGLFIIFISSCLLGVLVSYLPILQLPSLLGMLLAGLLLANISAINVVCYIDQTWSVSLRNIALVVILLRSGLELDPVALKRLKCTVVRLAFGPCITEAVAVAIMAYFLLDLPWLWGLQLGFVLGAVSPAIVVPQLLHLQELGFGVDQGIPTLVMAASSCDDVLAISLFTVFLGIAYSKGNLVFNICRGPLELLLGLTSGYVCGYLLIIWPNQKEKASLHEKRLIMLLSFGILLYFGSSWMKLSGAGALAVLTTSFVAAHGWGCHDRIPVVKAMDRLWMVFEPLMFGLIGAEVKMEYISSSLIGRGLATLTIGLLLRIMVTFVLTFGNCLNPKEKLFICIAWLPKATVQAATGAISLETARSQGYTGHQEEDYGIKILTLAVLVILMTAPLGALGIAVSGPRLLQRNTNQVGPSSLAIPLEDNEDLTAGEATMQEETASNIN